MCKYINKSVQNEEVDLIYPAMGRKEAEVSSDQKEVKIDMVGIHHIMRKFSS